MNIRKQPWHWPLALAFTLAMSACVTINIYFPAAAAEKAADKIIDEVWQEGQGTKPADDKPTDKSAQ